MPIVGLETSGSACFYHSMQSNRQQSDPLVSRLPEGATTSQIEMGDPFSGLVGDVQSDTASGVISLVHLTGITSRASSLGASSPSPGAVAMAIRRKGPVHCVTVSDERAMSACLKFAGAHVMKPFPDDLLN